MQRWAIRTLCAVAFIATDAGAAVITLSPTGPFTTLAAAVGAAQPGDTIQVQAATYVNQTATINIPLTILGVGGTPIFTATQILDNLKGFLVTNASVTVNNIQFENARSSLSSDNGAGIRAQAGDLTVLNSRFINNQSGILITPSVLGTGKIVVHNSYFQGNGVAAGQSGAGQSHAIYAVRPESLSVTNSTFEGTLSGHDIKSRAATTVIANNYLDDGVTGTTSYAIDISNGGNVAITGNTIVQGVNTQNSSMVAYGAEGLIHASNQAFVNGNIFSNSRPNGIGIFNGSSAVLSVTGNAFNGLSTIVVGPANLSGNVLNGPLPVCATPGVPPCPIDAPTDVDEPPMVLIFLLGLAGLALVSLHRRGSLVGVKASRRNRDRAIGRV